METVTLDDLDRGLAHALQLDGRAPFSKIAGVLGVSENTVARRYRRLRAAGVLRVVGALVGARLGNVVWTIRLRCTPDAAGSIAMSLARRPDTFWVHLLSGGTEISCVTQTRLPEERDALLLQKLARSGRVSSVTAHCVLKGFAGPGGWAGLSCLSPRQVEAMRDGTPIVADEPVELSEGDHVLLGALSVDGRTGLADLAVATGWSESTVSRRMDRLRRTGVLSYQVDLPADVLGYHAEARLWMSVRPSALVATAETLAGHPEVSFTAVTTGPTNLVATVICRDSLDLYRYLTERVATLDGITHVETAPVVRTVKRNGAVQPL
ncbi:Lrp/AsnC family transcriptional regulator [Saccharothrix syringae]|uniref:Lrp/AsnC family transcriptional regulator n=1 Tax=Saccharothrix syringae TaxID=103733 RepID=A0A5Q0H287_SACSY|nr:Lrp/AsnC family transcriptional regulator [Saccharothrix syringae]QFZ20356.1 Lrp/AsnC family transcriptional regulator [Saccharothrix syringae]